MKWVCKWWCPLLQVIPGPSGWSPLWERKEEVAPNQCWVSAGKAGGRGGSGGQGRCIEKQEQEQALDPVSWMPSPARALIHGGPGPGNGGVLFPLYARLMTASWFGMNNFILQIRLLKVRERNNFPKVPQNCLQTPSSHCKPLLRQHLLPSPWLSQLNEERRGPRCL